MTENTTITTDAKAYSLYLSNKIKNTYAERKKAGLYLGTYAPFGMQKDPMDNHRLIADPLTAPIVRKIYDMAFSGLRPTTIARVLADEKIVRPGNYCKSMKKKVKDENRYNWNPSSVLRILRNPAYIGKMWSAVKTKDDGYVGLNKREIVDANHEALIKQYIWDSVQMQLDNHDFSN